MFIGAIDMPRIGVDIARQPSLRCRVSDINLSIGTDKCIVVGTLVPVELEYLLNKLTYTSRLLADLNGCRAKLMAGCTDIYLSSHAYDMTLLCHGVDDYEEDSTTMSIIIDTPLLHARVASPNVVVYSSGPQIVSQDADTEFLDHRILDKIIEILIRDHKHDELKKLKEVNRLQIMLDVVKIILMRIRSFRGGNLQLGTSKVANILDIDALSRKYTLYLDPKKTLYQLIIDTLKTYYRLRVTAKELHVIAMYVELIIWMYGTIDKQLYLGQEGKIYGWKAYGDDAFDPDFPIPEEPATDKWVFGHKFPVRFSSQTTAVQTKTGLYGDTFPVHFGKYTVDTSISFSMNTANIEF